MNHYHKNIIQAWMDGESIQKFNHYGRWIDVVSFEDAADARDFSIYTEYRIKPGKKEWYPILKDLSDSGGAYCYRGNQEQLVSSFTYM